MKSFEDQLHIYFEGRENKLPQVSYKPMLKYFWDASAHIQQQRIDKLEKENAELRSEQSKALIENQKDVDAITKLGKENGEIREMLTSSCRKIVELRDKLDTIKIYLKEK